MIKITILNGPNLSILGLREPDVYGSESSEELLRLIDRTASDLGCSALVEQHDSQGELVAAVNRASEDSNGLVINPGGYSHTSVAVMDAMRAFKGPVVEVHVSQIHRREPYRHRMLTAQGADAVITGAGIYGYVTAIQTIIELLRR